VAGLGLSVGAEPAHRLLIRASLREEKSREDEVRGHAVRHRQLLAHRRHPRPRIENVRDTMAAESREELWLKERLVPNLDTILPADRECAEEAVEGCHEIAPVLKVARVKLRELEDQRADLSAKSLARPQERRTKKIRVEELRNLLARAGTVTRMIRELFDR